MAELIARSENEDQEQRLVLHNNSEITIGRAAEHWDVSWEPWLSRLHARLTWKNHALTVEKMADAKNPIYFRGEERDSFILKPGEQFVIGKTVFKLELIHDSCSDSQDDRRILNSFSVSRENLRNIPYRDAPHRLDVLGHLAKVIESAPFVTELHDQAVNLLLDGISIADVACLLQVCQEDEPLPVHVLASADRGNNNAFRPSSQLARQAIIAERKSVVHLWSKQDEVGPSFTLMGNFDWAFCTPLHGPQSSGMALYVAGRMFDASAAAALASWDCNDLTEEVKFAELVAAVIGALQHNRELQHRQGILSQFFSPGVRDLISAKDPEALLKPKETEVTVLFCDLRGFSRKVERDADNLLEVLARVSSALGIMTKCILDHKGVVADFLGDAALAFWGWPLSDQGDVKDACLAALDIQAEFRRIAKTPDHPLADFRVGVGIATGHAVAGQIGSKDQAKITVFGPVVNLASRLEGLTKILRVPILIDENTASYVKNSMPSTSSRCRRLARVRPYGLDMELDVSELLHPDDTQTVINSQDIQQYELALKAFLDGQWGVAYELLHSIPPQDLGKDLLLSYILQNNHTPPKNWDGVIPMQSKN